MTAASSKTKEFTEDNDIDLLDVLVIISSKIKIIIFLTLLGAAIGWLWAQMTPVVYNSTSSLNIEVLKTEEKTPQFKTEVIASLANSNQKFHDLLKNETWGKGATIAASTNPKDRLLIITTSATTPAKAKLLNEQVLENIYELTKATGAKAEQINAAIRDEQKRLEQIKQTIDSLERGKSTPENIESATFNKLLSYQTDREINLGKLQEYLKGIDENNIIQAPSLPESSLDRKMRTKISIGAVSGLFLALLLTFARYSINMHFLDEKNKKKCELIAKNLGLRSIRRN